MLCNPKISSHVQDARHPVSSTILAALNEEAYAISMGFSKPGPSVLKIICFASGLCGLVGSAFGLSCWTTIQENPPKYFGISVQGKRIGYEVHSEKPSTWNGKNCTFIEDFTSVALEFSGTKVELKSTWKYWITREGKPLRAIFERSSGRSRFNLSAEYSDDFVNLTINSDGDKSKKRLDLPDGAFAPDPYSVWVSSKPNPTTPATYFIDSDTQSLIKLQVKPVGTVNLALGGIAVKAELLEAQLSEQSLRAYYAADGSFLKLSYGNFMTETIPVSKEDALAKSPRGASGLNLDELLTAHTDRPIPDTETLTRFKLDVTGTDLASVPSDASQTIARDSERWIVDIHPIANSSSVAKISDVGRTAGMEKYLEIEDLIPCKSDDFKRLSVKLTGESSSVIEAALMVRDFVHRELRPDPSMSDPRDAGETLRSKRGMCINYAILCTTLLRAAGIPTRIVSGFEVLGATFFGHAWCEIWDGTHWIGVDATVDESQLSASHLKLSEGFGSEAKKRLLQFGVPKIHVLLVAH